MAHNGNAPKPFTYAASSIAIDGRAVLICGDSGIGKSALCLLMIDRGAQLISDDQTMLHSDNGVLYAAPHPTIKNQIEVRNIGIVSIDAVRQPVPVALKILLKDDTQRFRDAADSEQIGGISIPNVDIYPDLALAPLKLEYALQVYGGGIT